MKKNTIKILILLFVVFCTVQPYQEHDGALSGLNFNFYSAPLSELMSVIPGIEYVKCHGAVPYYYDKLPISPLPTDNQLLLLGQTPDPRSFFQPRQGILAETFVATIPGGIVCGKDGFVKCGAVFVRESFTQLVPFRYAVSFHYSHQDIHKEPIRHIQGRVAVLAHSLDQCYGHWFIESVGRLIMLQQSGVQYDWLYAPMNKDYMKKTYELFGIPTEKIIDSSRHIGYIKADEVVMPSQGMSRVPCQMDPVYECWSSTVFIPGWMVQDVLAKFNPIIEENIKNYQFPSKIFISRKDASYRQILNEDEIFALFEPLGFVRYALSDLSLLEQAMLFRSIDCVVAAHGSGLANILFCKKNTKIIEIFQNSYDTSFFNWAQAMQCQYSWIKTQPYNRELPQTSSYVDPEIIKQFLQTVAI